MRLRGITEIRIAADLLETDNGETERLCLLWVLMGFSQQLCGVKLWKVLVEEEEEEATMGKVIIFSCSLLFVYPMEKTCLLFFLEIAFLALVIYPKVQMAYSSNQIQVRYTLEALVYIDKELISHIYQQSTNITSGVINVT